MTLMSFIERNRWNGSDGPGSNSQLSYHSLAGSSLACTSSSPLEPHKGHFKAHLGALPAFLRERLAADGLAGTLLVDFTQPAAQGASVWWTLWRITVWRKTLIKL